MPTVLVVDDEPMVLRVLAKDLAGRSYEIMRASGGAEALAILAEREIDVVLTDQRMPDVTGFELLEAARERNPDTVGILMIYQRERDIGRQATSRGLAQRCIVKPWEFKEVPYAVDCAVETYRLRTENQRLRCVSASPDEPLPSSPDAAVETLGAILQMRCALEILARDLQRDVPGPDELASMRRTVRGMQQLIGHLPEHVGDTSPGGGPQCPLTAGTDLGRLIQRLADDLLPIAASRGVAIEFTGAADALTVDRDRTEPPLLLLLSLAVGNACEGGTVRVTTALDRSSVRVRVTDDGPPARMNRSHAPGARSPLDTIERMLDEAGGRLDAARSEDGRNVYALTFPAAIDRTACARDLEDRYTETMPDAFSVVIA